MSLELNRFDYEWTEGNTLPEITGTLRDTDISVGFTITLRVARPTTALVIAHTATDPLNGGFKFVWGPNDLIEGPDQQSSVTIVSPSGTITTKRFLIDVKGAIA